MYGRFVSNEKGFLLLEHLIAVVIMGILSITFLALMQVVASYRADQTALTMHEINTLAIRLQNEIRSANSLTSSTGQLTAGFADGSFVSFQMQNNRLTRQVNDRGGEILVYNIANMEVHLFDERSARLSLTSFDNELFQFYLHALVFELYFPADEDDENDDEEKGEYDGEEDENKEEKENEEDEEKGVEPPAEEDGDDEKIEEVI